jgi:hypothetical protein
MYNAICKHVPILDMRFEILMPVKFQVEDFLGCDAI